MRLTNVTATLVDLDGVEGGGGRGVNGQVRRGLVLGPHGLNVHDDLVGVNEDYVQRDEGVLHPEAESLLPLKDEDHAAVAPQALAAHQPHGALLRRVGDLQEEIAAAE